MSAESEPRVWIAQCLCGPRRHCILAAAAVCASPADVDKLVAGLRAAVCGLLAERALDPWCGFCGSGIQGWSYEPGRTRWRTMAEAEPKLRRSEAEQRLARELIAGQGRPTRA